MAIYSYDRYTSTGQASFAITFDYLSSTHIKIYLDGVLQSTGYSIDTGTNQVTFTSAPGSGVVVLAQRVTPKTKADYQAQIADFANGSVLSESDLDNAVLGLLYISQEAEDSGNTNAISKDLADNLWDAESIRIKNVGTPTGSADAVTKTYVDGLALYNSPVVPQLYSFTATASQTAFALSPAPTSTDVQSFIVDLDGVVQKPTTDFTVSGSTLTLTTGASLAQVLTVRNIGVTRDILGDSSTVTSTGSTTARSLATRFAEVTNVKDYGAVGDGSTDDAPAIQAAIDAATTNGGSVFFPQGTYSVEAIILLKTGVSLIGNRREATIRGGASIVKLIEFRTATNSSIEGLKLDGNNNVTSYVVEFGTGATRCSVIDCEITDTGATNTVSTGQTMIETRTDSIDNLVDRCYIHDCWVGIKINMNTKNLTISRNKIENYGGRGIYGLGQASYAQYIRITENYFGIPLAGAVKHPISFDKDPDTGNPIQYVSIQNNTFVGPNSSYDPDTTNTATADCISLHQVKFFQIIGNIIYNQGDTGITVSQGSMSGLIADNFIRKVDTVGIAVGSRADGAETTRRVTVRDNHIEQSGENRDGAVGTHGPLSGIRLAETDLCSVVGNTIIDNDAATPTMRHGIVIDDSTNVYWQSNHISLQAAFSISDYAIETDTAAPLDGNSSFRGHSFSALPVDPTDPPADVTTIWQSDGTGSGDDGDIMMKITDSDGTTKTTTLVDYSAIT